MSASLFEHLFDISPFPAVVSRLRDKAVLAINRRTSEMFGVPHAEAVGLFTTGYYANPEDRRLLAEPLEREGKADNVLLELVHPKGGTFWARASARLVLWEGEPAVLTVFDDISEELSAERALRESEQRLAAQSSALTELTARHADPHDKFEDRLRGILEVAAATLQAERVSMWRFAAARSAIECVGLFRYSPARHESGARLVRAEFPAYFAALESERVIAAHDAMNDPRTGGFSKAYLDPENIGAMLDVPLRQETVVSGVLCVEHVGGPRTWTLDEQNFAISTANLIAVAIADESRREALARVARSDARAHLILDTAHDAFVGMDSAGTITAWNAQAQQTFGWTRAEAIGRSLADTIIPPAFREAHNSGMALPPDRRRAGREQAARAARPASRRTRVSDRDHHYVADAARRGLLFRRPPARHLGSARARRPAAPRQGSRGSGDPREERVPGQHEPRAAHAAQWRDWLLAGAPARPRPDRDTPRGARRDLQVRRAPARPDQRHAGPVQNRGRLHRQPAGRYGSGGADPRSPPCAGGSGPPQGCDVEHDRARRCAPACGARRPPPAPGTAEPAGQRHQVHHRGRSAARHRAHRAGAAGIRGERHRRGHRPEVAHRDFRRVHADQDRRRGGRHGPRPHHQPAPGAADGWGAASGEHARPRQPVLLHASAGAGERRRVTRCARGRSAAGREARARSACDRARGRRQHGQPADPGQPARKRRAQRDHGDRRSRRTRPRQAASSRRDLHGCEDARSRRLRRDATARGRRGDRAHSGYCRDRECVGGHAPAGEGSGLRRLRAQAGAGRSGVRRPGDAFGRGVRPGARAGPAP